MNLKTLVALLLVSLSLHAQDFTEGDGSEFSLEFKDGTRSNLSIYVTESKMTSLGIEYYFNASNTFIPIQLWQQFHFSFSGEGPLSVDKGFVYALEMKAPEALTGEYLNVNKGVKVNDFLFSKRSEIDGSKVGEETIEVPAGSVVATHYRKTREGQTVDFWISDKTKPIGLVKLVSKNERESAQNYTIELMSLVKGVKAKIDPEKAVPLTDKGKAYLAHPLKNPKK